MVAPCLRTRHCPQVSPLPLGWWKLATGFSNETLPAPLPRSLRAPHRTLATYPHLIPAGGNTTSGPTIKSKFPPHSSCFHVKAECLSFPPLQHCRVFTNNDLGQRISQQKKSYRFTVPQSPTIWSSPKDTGSDKGFRTGDQSPKITTTTLMFG